MVFWSDFEKLKLYAPYWSVTPIVITVYWMVAKQSLIGIAYFIIHRFLISLTSLLFKCLQIIDEKS